MVKPDEEGCTLSLDSVSMVFGDHPVLFAVNATFVPGKLHALIGENGAGKSTLLAIAAGSLQATKGQVKRLPGGGGLADASARVAVVHQHYALIPSLTLREHLAMVYGEENPFVPYAEAALEERLRYAREVLGDLPAVDVPVSRLTVGEKQRVEIVRALASGAKTILLDEPTALLTPGEVSRLFATLNVLAERGFTVVFVTHRIAEVDAYADHVVALRAGKVVLDVSRARGSGAADILAAIMGDAALSAEPVLPKQADSEANEEPSGELLRIEGLARSIVVKPGERVGIAGIEGNGQDALVYGLLGLGAPLACSSLPPETIACVPPDRHREGLLAEDSLVQNATVGSFHLASKFGVIVEQMLVELAKARLLGTGLLQRLGTSAGLLSGGNQQKIVFGRALAELNLGKKALILCNPTRGVDYRTAAELWRRVESEVRVPVLVQSADLAELRRYCHRIFVMRKGELVAEFPAGASETAIGQAMLGETSEVSDEALGDAAGAEQPRSEQMS
jgi:general nucleoside transport system ATP-binding protein